MKQEPEELSQRVCPCEAMRVPASAVLFVALVWGWAGTRCWAAEAVDAKTKAAFAAARFERIAVVGIGDSNQRFGGHGWSLYMAKALSRTFGCYGSELKQFKFEDKKDAAIPEGLRALGVGGWYLAPGASARPDWRNGTLIVPADHSLGVDGNLRFHLWHGAFPGGGGNFQLAVRRDQPPWTILAKSPEPQTTPDAPESVQELTLDLPAEAGRNYPVMFSVMPVNVVIEGPFYGNALFAENTDKTTGIAYHTLYAQGGQSLFDMLKTIRDEWGARRVAGFFRKVRTPLNGAKRCVVMVSSGLNDRNEKLASIGPKGGFGGNTPDAFEDNFRGLIAALQASWTEAGGEPGNLFIAIMPSHPVSENGREDMLVSYRNVASRVAQEFPNVGCILLPELITQSEMAEKGYYDKGTPSNPHLDRSGYEAISEAVAQALEKGI